MRRRPLSPEAKKAGAAAFAGAIAAAALGLGAAAGPPSPPPRPAPPSPAGTTVEVQLLGVNDFHGHLEPPRASRREPGAPPVALGGAAALDGHLDRATLSHPGRTIRVHAGDMLGASPLISSRFHDEPTVRAMNLMRFDVGTLGNHEFDEGGDELIRLLRGGRRRDGLRFKRDAEGHKENTSAPDFEGVRFPYVAANTVDREGELRLPPAQVISRGGVRVGFIGVTTQDTPDYLLREHRQRFRFLDISETVNRQAARLRRRGVEAIVVLAHSGARHVRGDRGAAQGEIVDEARQMTGAVDVVIAGHTHSRLNTRVPNRDGRGSKLVIEAMSLGVAYDRVRLTIDQPTGEVLRKAGETPPTWNDEVRPDPEIRALVTTYARRVAPLANRVIGRTRHALERGESDEPRESMAWLAARAQRELARADFAFVNESSTRASLDRGPITYAELFEASALEHPVLAMELRGREVRSVLERQLRLEPQVLLTVSGLSWERDGDRVGRVLLPRGRTLDPGRHYTVAANAQLVDGSGDFPEFRAHGRAVRAVGTDLQALLRHLSQRPG